ncbi:MAG: hypothetical protein ACQEV0_08810 [Bacillota bacterium]
MSYVPILHLTVPAVWVSVLLAAVAASLLQRFVTKEKTGEWFWNAVALYIITWKLSYVLFNFENFRDMPLSLLYFNGGLSGHLLGIILVIIYLAVVQKKHGDLAKQSAFTWLLFFLSYQAILQSFDSNAMEAVFHAALLAISISALRVLPKREDVPTGWLLASLYTLELLILTAFGPLFTWQNATVITLAAFTTIWYIRYEKKGKPL